ncbi:hypothetical protein PFLUV_G00102320 [Perca fluviatilis]|uniref:Uncharacterized protein n=1 Tax=Perca fluviatilis TaxID=8168 RepID=A0A6A5ECY5_PERFL|nr:hypothetical protein PFLUV_G00102320 [Perca fluviatilis]
MEEKSTRKRMDCQGENCKKKKTKKMRLYEPDPGSPKDDQDAYVMRCGTLDGWTPVEKAKVKKALITKCCMRIAKTWTIYILESGTPEVDRC